MKILDGNVMASSNYTTTTQEDTKEEVNSTNATTLKLCLKKEKGKKIQWTEDTVDNEGKWSVMVRVLMISDRG